MTDEKRVVECPSYENIADMLPSILLGGEKWLGEYINAGVVGPLPDAVSNVGMSICAHYEKRLEEEGRDELQG